jgi:regulator of replication initiation timing
MSKNFEIDFRDLNALYEHIEIIHDDNQRLFDENKQLEIERNELKARLVTLEQEVADKDVHIVQMHSDMDRIESLYNQLILKYE